MRVKRSMMKLSEVISGVPCVVHGDVDVRVRGIAYDSRNVKEGFMFIAMPGEHVDGKVFVSKAIEAGASVVVADTIIAVPAGIVLVVACDVRSCLANMAANYYNHPDKKMLMVGVTGTNGKTTITYLVESIFRAAKLSTGVVGTVNYRYSGLEFASTNTTPQSAELYRILHEMVRTKQAAAVMEVSSHALVLNRVEGIEFDIAIFTNLTRDHLDYHVDMEKYFDAKRLLFAGLGHDSQKGFSKNAVVNVDDEWGRRFRNSFHPRRCGDVMLSYRPEYVEDYGQGRGISYGSLYNYDAGVPLCLYGPRFRSGLFESPVEAVDVAPTLARACGVPLPSSSTGRVLAEALAE